MTEKPNKKCNLGDEVRIKFLDHSEGKETQEFYARGRVVQKNAKQITVETWGPVEFGGDDADGHNSHSWAIGRALIIHIDVTIANPNARKPRSTRKTSPRVQGEHPTESVPSLPVVGADQGPGV
jgi:hypothetical protein